MASKTKYKYPLVEVIWFDAEAGNGWLDKDDDKELPKVVTVGFKIFENDSLLIIASTYHEDETNSRMKIPKGMIISQKEKQ